MLTREQLQSLDKDTLIDMVLKLNARVIELEHKLLSLEARLAQNSKNSSKPPSSDPPFRYPEKKKSDKKSGGQPGHKGHGLSKAEAPDHVQEHVPEQCECCGGDLSNQPAVPAGTFQVFDLPEDIKIEVTEHRRFTRLCPGCGKESCGALPAGLCPETPCQWGVRCRTLAVYLMQQQHLPYERTQEVFVDLFGSAPSEGTLYNWLQMAYETLAPVESKIADALVESARVGADETPVKGAGWVHALVNDLYTWYGCHSKRGREAMESFGHLSRFDGLLMSDCLGGYCIYGRERSLCNAHLLRDLKAVSEQGHLWSQRMASLLVTVKEQVARIGGALSPSELHKIYRWWGRLLSLGWIEQERYPALKASALLRRLDRYRDEYLRFATTAGAWFDNNRSEQSLRMLKLHVKIGGCFRSVRGCEILCRVRGYLSTMKKQGQSLFAALKSVMSAQPLLPPLLQNPN